MQRFEIIVDFGGIVIFDPDRLTEYFGGIDVGTNLYRRFITTDDGERVVEAGIVTPILGINDSIYEVDVRLATEPALVEESLIIFENSSFPLHIRERCIIADLGSLLEWSPPNNWHTINMAPGYYSVNVRGYRNIQNSLVIDFGFEIVFTHMETLPAMSASMTQDMQVLSLPD